MGAISSESSVQILKQYLNDPNRSVRETCEIALAKIEWDSSPEGKTHHSTPIPEYRCVPCVSHPLLLTSSERAYTSIDPAPPTSGLLKGKPAPEALSRDSVESLRVSLTDPALPLFERYRAMFALRNIGTNEAVDALASGFTDDSALFKFVPRRHHRYPVFLSDKRTLDQARNCFCVRSTSLPTLGSSPCGGPEEYTRVRHGPTRSCRGPWWYRDSRGPSSPQRVDGKGRLPSCGSGELSSCG